MYRHVQATLDLQANGDRPSTIAISSAVPGEGQSTVIANLAMAVAELGRSVLLIDADLVEALSRRCSLAKVLHPVRPRLHLLPAGQQLVNPIGLLQSKRFAAFLKQASAHYDLVAIDTPPLGVAADALMVGHLSDGIILVARPGSFDNGSATAAKAALNRSGQTVLGLILNAIDGAKSTDKSFEKLQRYYTKSSYNPSMRSYSRTALSSSSR